MRPVPGEATELDPPEPAPPLGLGPRPEPLQLMLAQGDRILLYTDGVSEARARGGFFPLQAAAFALVSADLEAGLESLWDELQRHVAGQVHDDVRQHAASLGCGTALRLAADLCLRVLGDGAFQRGCLAEDQNVHLH
jgi:hypothetical protein